MSTERILIIGGTGYIGRNLALKCLEIGHSVTVLSINSLPENLKINKVTYVHCNISSIDDLHQKINNYSFEYVVNLSGYVDHSNFSDGGASVIDNHLTGVLNILKIIDWDPLKRFVQIGSSDEYGKNEAPQNEKFFGDPFSPYSFGKLAATQLLQMLHRTESFPMVVIRLFLVYGPKQNSSRFIPQIIEGCLSGKQFPVSTGDQLRDFCYIDDIIRGIVLTLNNKNVIGEIINLGSGNPISIKKMILKIKNGIGMGYPNFGQYQARPNENMKLYADITKAKIILDWQPNIDLEEGLKKTIKSFK
jgi:nucleoside-diphosphate-sugar epimerase